MTTHTRWHPTDTIQRASSRQARTERQMHQPAPFTYIERAAPIGGIVISAEAKTQAKALHITPVQLHNVASRVGGKDKPAGSYYVAPGIVADIDAMRTMTAVRAEAHVSRPH